MSSNLPRRIAGATIPRQCPPPPDGWFGTHQWPLVDADDSTRRAVDVLCNTELPEDLQELGELLRRVLDGLTNLPAADPPGDAACITLPAAGPASACHGSDRAR